MKISTIRDLELAFLYEKKVAKVRTIEHLEEPALVICVQPYNWYKFRMILSDAYKKKFKLQLESVVRRLDPEVIENISIEIVIEL